MKENKSRNKNKIEKALEKFNYKIGCYDKNIEKISLKELPRVIDALDYDASDVIVSIRGAIYIVEIFTVDNEVDLSIISFDNYLSQYGNNGIEEKVEDYIKETSKDINKYKNKYQNVLFINEYR